jgi:neutral ceramidase
VEPVKDPAHCRFEPAPARDEGPAAAASPVKAGLGSRVLPMPIGAPLGGYGDRVKALGGTPADARAWRFTKAFVPSVGMHDAPRSDALAIEAGGERFVIVRMDVTLVTENTLFEIEQAAAPDGSLRGRIMIAASHSHAAWAGWQTSLILMPGIDRPRRDLADRIVSATADAVKDAILALEPARVGVAVDPAFDPMDTVSHDRRGENNDILGPDGNTAGKGKDPHVWALRVDRMDGTPLAAVVDLPIHGTVGDSPNPMVSTDIGGAIGRALSAELGYPVLHIQGAAGDISPEFISSRTTCPDETRCLDMPGLEVVGARAATLVAPLVKGIETGDKASLEVVTRTFYEGRAAVVERPDGTKLSYAAPDVEPDGVLLDMEGRIALPVDEFTTEAGAGLCGDSEAGSFGPLYGASGPYSSCVDIANANGRGIIFGLFDIPADAPVPLCDTLRTTATAVRISGTPSGDWLIASIPGEPTAPYAAYLRARSPAGPDRTLVVGYANDHAGYILTAEDWLAGGYEPSTNLWGPLEGEIILDGILEAARIAWTPEREDPEAGTSRFVDWPFPETAPIKPIVTADHGKPAPAASVWWPDTKDAVPGAPAAQVSRAVGAARFAWFGGDPAVDLPEVIIEREAAPGAWAPLLDARGLPASSREGAVVITYTPDPLESPDPARHVYAAVWQPLPPDPFLESRPAAPFSLPLGRYRFRVKGAAVSAMGAGAYDVASDGFEVVAAPLDASSTAVKGAASIDVRAMLPAAPGFRALLDGPSDTKLPLPGPWTVTVTFADASTKQVTAQPDASGKATLMMPASEVAAAASVDVRDEAGNGGALALP